MQLFINNWSTSLTVAATAEAVQLSVPPVEAAKLIGLGTGDHYLLTLFQRDPLTGIETRREIVRCTDVTGGVLDVARGQEGTTAQVWDADLLIEARLTKATMETLRDSGGPTLSDTAPEGPGTADAGVSPEASRADHVHPLPTPAEVGAATAAQGALADTAVQPADLATVATTGAYADLTGKPTIPSAAAEVGAIATTEKGAANGVATLGTDSKIPLAQLPATAITSTSVVANEAAMLALAAQEGDVAIRPDINTSFILAAEPASTLSNWQEILAPSAGGGAPVGSSTPQPLGTATPGVSSSASRQDHVHGMPSAADVGADPAGTAAAAVAAHAGTGGAAHANAVAGGAAGFMTGADKDKLDDIAAGATANADTDSLTEGSTNLYHTAARVRAVVLTGLSLADSAVIAATDTVLQAIGKLAARLAMAFDRANHSGSQAISTVTGLQAVLDKATFATVVTDATTARTAVVGDAGSYLRFTNDAATAYTIAPQASVAWPVDAEVHVRRVASANLTLTPGSGVTLNAPSGGTLVMTNAMSVTLKRVADNVWDVIGQTVAA